MCYSHTLETYYTRCIKTEDVIIIISDNGFVLVANLSTDLVAIKPDDEVCTGGPYDDTCQSTTNTAQPLHPTPDNMELVPLNLKDWW